MPGLTLGDVVPDLELDTTHGKIRLHDFVGDAYVIIFSHPGIYSVLLHYCRTACVRAADELEKLRC
jgi:1-Cys peroxiredoxin 6